MFKKTGKVFLLIVLLVIISCYGAHVRPPVVLQQNQIQTNPELTTAGIPTNTNNRVAYKNSKNIIHPTKTNSVQNWPRWKQSSVVQDWNLVCEQLCGAGLGGQSCASHCPNVTQSQNELLENAEDILNPNKNVICEDLCKLQLGGNICQCMESDSLIRIKEDGQNLVCETFCDHNKISLSGCSLCQKIISFKHPLNSRMTINQTIVDNDNNNINTTTSTIIKMPTNSTPSTTTPDWNAICKDLCKTGDGGALCNCDLPPFV